MKEIKKALQQRLAQKNLASLSIGAFLLHQIKQKSKDPDAISGHLKREILTVRLGSKDDKTKWFMERVQLKTELNSLLQEHGYALQLKEVKIY